MGELIKIREVSLKYDISARALKYYEDMGLIRSTKSQDYADFMMKTLSNG